MTRPSWQDFATHDESAYPELWDGVVGAWCPSLGPTGSRLHDMSRRSNWGTLTNMDPATDWVVSDGLYALDFDGANDRVDTLLDIPLQQMAFAIWVTPRIITSAQSAPCGDLTGGAGTALILWSTSQINWILRGGSASDLLIPANVVLNTPVHIVCSLSDAPRIYVNGLLSGIGVGTSFSRNTGVWKIGGINISGYYANCIINEHTVWSRPLTQSEAMQLYRLGPGGMYQRRRRTLRRVAIEQAGFRAYWARRQNQIIGGGV